MRSALTRYTGIKGDPPPLDKTGKSIWPMPVKRAAMPIVAEFNGIIEEAKAGLLVTVFDLRNATRAVIGNYWHSGMRPPPRLLTMPAKTPGLIQIGRGTYILDDDTPMTITKPADALVVVDTAEVIGLWKKQHSINRTVRPKAIRRKHAVMREFFEFADIPPLREVVISECGERPIPIFDLTQAGADDLQRYKESLNNGKAFDALSHILALYTIAADERRFAKLPGGNPMRDMKAPPKPKSEEWEPYTEDEARTILVPGINEALIILPLRPRGRRGSG